MDYVLAPIFWILGLLFSIVWWIVWQLLMIILWLVLPVVIVAIVALRVAERMFGQERVRNWVKARTAKYGFAASDRARRIVFALGVMPFRVMFWFVFYAFWHVLVSLLWRPKWSAWDRAWAKRWRPQQSGSSRRAV